MRETWNNTCTSTTLNTQKLVDNARTEIESRFNLLPYVGSFTRAA